MSHCSFLVAWPTPIQSSRPNSTISSSLEPSLSSHTEQMTPTSGFVPLLYLVHFCIRASTTVFHKCLNAFHKKLKKKKIKCLPSLQNGELFKERNYPQLMSVVQESNTVPNKPQGSMKVCWVKVMPLNWNKNWKFHIKRLTWIPKWNCFLLLRGEKTQWRIFKTATSLWSE